MRWQFRLVSISVAVLCTLVLAGCQGLVMQQSYQLNVTSPTSGTGTITSSPAGINCPTVCSATFGANTPVTLTATPAANYAFTGWSGACSGGASTCSVTLNAAETVAAAFAAGYGLTVTLAGSGGGTVTSNPVGISCSSGSCTGAFPQNAQITLTEAPAAGSVFSGWSGACSGSGTCSVTLTAANSVTVTFNPAGTILSLNHIILFAQENRSLDHYFGAMQQYWSQNGYGTSGQTFDGLPQFGPTVNGVAPTAPSVPGCASGTSGDSCSPDASNPISSFHFQSICMENQSPFWNEAHNQWDYLDPSGVNINDSSPPLNGFVFTAAYDAGTNGFLDVEGVRAMGYLDGSDLNYYYFLASNFATSDRWFAPVMSRTQINRMYMLAATSQGHAYPIGQGLNNGTQLTSTPIFEELQNANVTWKVYEDPTGLSDTSGQSCSSMTGSALSACLVENSYINEFSYEETILNSPTLLQNFQPISQFAVDAANSALPQFALIEPASSAGLDEHPSDSDDYPVNVQAGENYAATMIINPFMQSPSWSDSALILTYDEWGGYYDHVPPQPATPPGDFNNPTDLNPAINDICTGAGQLGNGMCTFGWTGYRVPVIVISPFANKNYVSHTVRDTTSVLALVEQRFGLNALTARDAAQPSMSEFFNFGSPAWATPPTPPAPNQSGTCSLTPPASWNEP